MDWTNPPSRPSVGQQVTVHGERDRLGRARRHDGTLGWDFGERRRTDAGRQRPRSTRVQSLGLKAITLTVTNQAAMPETTTVTKLVCVNAAADRPLSASDPDPATAGRRCPLLAPTPATRTATRQVRVGLRRRGTDSNAHTPVHSFAARRHLHGDPDRDRSPTAPRAPSTHDVVVRRACSVPRQQASDRRFAFGPRTAQGRGLRSSSSRARSTAEGKLREQAWDLDGDGQFDDARGDEVFYTFTSPGEDRCGCG